MCGTTAGPEHWRDVPHPTGPEPAQRVSDVCVLPPVPDTRSCIVDLRDDRVVKQRIAPDRRQRGPCVHRQLERSVHPWIQVDHAKISVGFLHQLEFEDAPPSEVIEKRGGRLPELGGQRQRDRAGNVPGVGGPGAHVATVRGRHEPLVCDYAAQRVNGTLQATLHQYRHAEILDRCSQLALAADPPAAALTQPDPPRPCRHPRFHKQRKADLSHCLARLINSAADLRARRCELSRFGAFEGRDLGETPKDRLLLRQADGDQLREAIAILGNREQGRIAPGQEQVVSPTDQKLAERVREGVSVDSRVGCPQPPRAIPRPMHHGGAVRRNDVDLVSTRAERATRRQSSPRLPIRDQDAPTVVAGRLGHPVTIRPLVPIPLFPESFPESGI